MNILLRGCAYVLLACCSSPMMASSLIHAEDPKGWKIDGDRYECRMQRDFAPFGQVSFFKRPGEPVFVEVDTHQMATADEKAWLEAIPPPWRHDQKALVLSELSIKSENPMIRLSPLETQKVLRALHQGFVARMRYTISAVASGSHQAIDLSPIHFGNSYRKFTECTLKLLPFRFGDVAENRILFAPSESELHGKNREILDKVIAYLKAGAEIESIIVRAHTDHTGRFSYNRQLARARGKSVQDYFIYHGLEKLVKVDEDDVRQRLRKGRYVEIILIPKDKYRYVDEPK